MSVKPLLGDWEIPRIERIRADEHRRFAELPVPGKAGNLLQDLNRSPSLIEISGSLFASDERLGFLQDIRERFNSGDPLTFVADITEATDLQYVVIEQLTIEESSDYPDEIRYAMKLRESPPPPPPSGLLDGLNNDLLDQAGDFIDGVTNVLDAIDALTDIPDLSDPGALLGDSLTDVTSAVTELDNIQGLLDNLFGDG